MKLSSWIARTLFKSKQIVVPISFEKLNEKKGRFSVRLPVSRAIGLNHPERIGEIEGKLIYFSFWVISLGSYPNSPHQIIYTFYQKK